MNWQTLSLLLPLLLFSDCFGAERKPVNLARTARASASSEYSGQYLATLAVDGVIPELLSKDDIGRAWAVNGARARGKAWFVLEWDEPVRVSEIIYYGRTSWLVEECWKDYEVRLDDGEQTVATGRFEMNAGGQRIPVETSEVRRIRLDFSSSYGGPNPGAAEIEIYADSPPSDALPKLKRFPSNLARRARVNASSEYSAQYLAKFAVDGEIPPPFARGDPGKAWAVKGLEAKDKAEFSLEWDRPVSVCEVAYYGRTAVLIEEGWKDYELYANDETEPLAKGTFGFGSGAQPIRLVPREVRKLTFRFLSSYGGPNPGAAEIQVYDEPTPADWLPRFMRGGWDQPEESVELTRAVSSGELGFDSLLVIQRHELNPSHVYTACCEGFRAGGGLYTLTPPTPDGSLTELVASPEGQIMDYDLSYDAREVVFSWRQTTGDSYHLYRMNADGSGMTQLTEGPWHDYNACWLPDGGIAFVSTRHGEFVLCFTTPSGVLFRMDKDGGSVRRLSANNVNDFTPSVFPDGRILYSRWEYVDKPAIPIQSLWTLRPDGRGLSVFYGNRVLSPASFLEAQALPGEARALCTLTAHNGPIRGGIGVVDRRLGVNAQAAIRNLTPQVDIGRVDQGSGNHVRGPFEGPYPIGDDRFLVSGKGSVYVGDLAGRWALLMPKDQSIGFYNPRPLRARARPPIVAASEPPEHTDRATVFVADVYQGLTPEVERGAVTEICVVQEVAKPLRTAVMGFGFQRPVISCGATYAAKRVLGYAPVEEDGSAHFAIPAELPVYFEVLDSHGRALQRMRSFTHLAAGEQQGCVGCHEPRGRTGLRRRTIAARRAPSTLRPPEWGEANFDYTAVVQPVLDRYCIRCHSGADAPKGLDLSGAKTDWFSVSYDVLTRGYVSWIDTRNGREANIGQIAPLRWGSPASRLAQIVLDGHPDSEGKERVRLDATSARRVFAWIDLNVPYYGTFEMAYPKAEGGRRLYPEDLDARLADVAQRRCVSCHQQQVPSRGFVRLTDPELNDFLVAPLAKTAGGRQSCGEPVFASTSDPDYRALLELFKPVRELLATTPRMDMPGAKASGANRSCL